MGWVLLLDMRTRLSTELASFISGSISEAAFDRRTIGIASYGENRSTTLRGRWPHRGEGESYPDEVILSLVSWLQTFPAFRRDVLPREIDLCITDSCQRSPYL